MNNHIWRLIEDGPVDGKLNMAIDRAILTACERGQAPATLRLYGWEKPTLSIGYSQNKLRDVDTVQCERRNISIVRRFTGGRALLHQYELTYSLVAPIPHPRFPGNLAGAFGAVSKAVIFSLEKAGVGFVSITEQTDFSTPIGKVMLANLAAFGQYYSDNISAEVKRA